MTQIHHLPGLSADPHPTIGIVLDQWGVLHDGTAPYSGVPEVLARLKASGHRLAVLSNSGKRAAPNAERIGRMGIDPTLFEAIMTSGEALWHDVATGRVDARRLLAVARTPGDAEDWAKGLDIALVEDVARADAILLMGLPDDANAAPIETILQDARARCLPVLCSNPDLASPRAGGRRVASPGALAHAHESAGGAVAWYGKPHAPVFRALEAALNLPPTELTMVGDSLAHDIAGGHRAGWRTAFVRGGLHAAAFAGDGDGDAASPDPDAVIRGLARAEDAPLPDIVLPLLA